MSSMTAAASTTLLASALIRPIDDSTLAVMPTEVATIVAPRNIASIRECPGHTFSSAQPAVNGTTTPNTATRVAVPPTFRI